MAIFRLIVILLGVFASPALTGTGLSTEGYLLSDEEAGYDQAAYDDCIDSVGTTEAACDAEVGL